MNPARIRAILDFWFLPAGDPAHGSYRPQWFRKNADFDREIREHFGAEVEQALAAPLPDAGDAATTLAQILLRDQFPRNLFRDSARAFAGDAQALALANDLVSRGADKNLPPMQRWFTFLPFEHSESLLDQERSVALFAGLRREAQLAAFDSAYDYALRHREVIARFGRFPHRNRLLGRTSTPEEETFLRQPGAAF